MVEKFMLLSNGVKIPSIGFGTYKSGDDEETAKIIKNALNLGYKMIDTASFYNNEVGIGNGIKESGIDRKDIFIVTKLWNDDHGYDNTIEAFNKSLNNLQVDYIDLYLIHWPNKLNAETWRAFEHLYETGKVKAIGVCNFKVEHLEELKKTAKIMPMVNQVEIHPFSTKNNIINYCKDNKEKETAQVFWCLNVIFLFILHFDSVYLAIFMLKRPFFSFVIISQTPKPTRNNRSAIPPPAPSAGIKISPHSILNV